MRSPPVQGVTDDHDRFVTFAVWVGIHLYPTTQRRRCLVEWRSRNAGNVRRKQVNGVWYPVRQAFAIRHAGTDGSTRYHGLAVTCRTGFATHGNVQHRDQPVINPVDENPPAVEPGPIWHTEARMLAVVASLRERGWHIASEANTATRERGIDIVATG